MFPLSIASHGVYLQEVLATSIVFLINKTLYIQDLQ